MSDPSWFVSLLTPNAPAGVAVIELRGAGVSIALERVGAGIGVPGSFALVHLWSHGERLDEALVCTRALDRVELHVHGSVPLVQEIVEILKPNDELAVAEPLTLQQACWLAMSEAPSEWGARIALAQSEGLLEREIQRLVDLPDAEFLPALAQLEAHGRRARRWLEPTRIALQGPPNAGKSTLFNALMGYTRVVTSGEAGPTRDPVLEATLLGTWPVELVDTAGLRPVDSQSLEGRGQSLGQRLAREAEVVFHLVPHGEGADAPEGTHALITHGDRPGAPQTAIDALNQPLAAVGRVAERLTEILDGGPGWQLDWAAPCTHGQRQVVSQAVSSQEPGGAKRLLRGLLG